MRNETQRAVRIMVETEDLPYKLEPGDSVGVEVEDGPIQMFFYDGGLQLVGACRRKQV